MSAFRGRTREPGHWENGRREGRLGSSSDPQADTQLLAICVSSPRASPVAEATSQHVRSRNYSARRAGASAASRARGILDGNRLPRAGQSHLQGTDLAGAPRARAPPRRSSLSSSPGGEPRSPAPAPSRPRGNRNALFGRRPRSEPTRRESLPFAGGRWAGGEGWSLGRSSPRRSGGKSQARGPRSAAAGAERARVTAETETVKLRRLLRQTRLLAGVPRLPL